MGIAANKFRLLYLLASKSDTEFKIFKINQKRMALLDTSEVAAKKYANTIFQSGQRTDLYDGDSPGIFPWMTNIASQNPFNATLEEDPMPTGMYEAEMAIIHDMDKEYELEGEKLKSFYEAKKTEIESVQEILKKNTEKDYKTFG
ncbi:MAG TPA: hypothetical protein P5556_07735 [Candidatus Gastranaerophilales bacterium]|nr:hypothetical protein [Candidatus Gastranaerophilales bacterium]